MTLKETAFMINLIKKNYRRRMTVHMFGIALILGGFVVMLATNMLSTSAWFIIAACLISIATGLLMFLNDRPFGMQNFSPRDIKKEQLEVLKQNAEGEFRDLIHSTILKEYL